MSDDSSSDFREANGHFAKGDPGGPGRPGAVNRITEFDRLVAEAGPELIEGLLTAAKDGNLNPTEESKQPSRRGS